MTAHDWFDFHGLRACRRCGLVKRDNRPDSACPASSSSQPEVVAKWATVFEGVIAREGVRPESLQVRRPTVGPPETLVLDIRFPGGRRFGVLMLATEVPGVIAALLPGGLYSPGE